MWGWRGRARRRAHPRVGGENAIRAETVDGLRGSSPRGRGKLRGSCPAPLSRGLIPAWAGKTSSISIIPSLPRAHPRVGGENMVVMRAFPSCQGSSPRGRGKPPPPARTSQAQAAHPRVGGENIAEGHTDVTNEGSSPRGRGKPSAQRTWVTFRMAHPRVGGENASPKSASDKIRGSSPRGRGKLGVPLVVVWCGRLIPAWAGKTTYQNVNDAATEAHPRVGGENLAEQGWDTYALGSSPRGRGKQKSKK